jgi:organic radical activating enzyme
MQYPIAERFKSIQGEGLFTGTPMVFYRFVGCSVNKTVCVQCDTQFDRINKEKGGGKYSIEELLTWAGAYRHICLTGGEPLDRDLLPLLLADEEDRYRYFHLETSGTKHPEWMLSHARAVGLPSGQHAILVGGKVKWFSLWVTVSPKPGYLPEMIEVADEIKVILGGLGSSPNQPGWPTLADATEWADKGKLVYIQPCNHEHEADQNEVEKVLEIVHKYPQLRVSAQLHKYLTIR